MGRLNGKVALITGAALAGGQGACEAGLFAAEGATVVMADVEDVAGEETAAAIGAAARYVHLDVTDADGWAALVSDMLELHGRLDVLVNNAGVWHTGGVLQTSPEDYRRVVEINQTGVFLGMRAVAPVMREQRAGSILNVSSAAGLRGDPRTVAYTASKWAVRGMTKGVALELAAYGVRVNSLHPGLIRTPMSATEFAAGRQDPGAGIPIGRAGEPDEVAELACYLASDASAYVTGAEITIDGGMTA